MARGESRGVIRRPAHFAVHRHRVTAMRAYPLVCVLQSPLVGGETRIVAPLGPADAGLGPTAPRLVLDGMAHAVLLRQLSHMPLRAFAEEVGSAEALRDEIVRGLDLLFTGL